MNLSSPGIILAGALCLLAVGFYGLMASRNLIKVVVAMQILLKGALLAIILAGSQTGKMDTAQSMALNVIVVDTLAAVIGLALAVQIRRHTGTLDARALSRLRR